MSETERHIADDPEALEAFLLGRLGKSESDGVASHLRTCRRCFEAVESERRLIAAIRRSGRDGMKAKLSSALSTSDADVRVTVPWPRILAVAATIVLLIGLGITGRWLSIHHAEQEPTFQQPPQALRNGPAPSTQSQPPETPAPAPQITEGAHERSLTPEISSEAPSGVAKGKVALQQESGRQANAIVQGGRPESAGQQIAEPERRGESFDNARRKDQGRAINGLLRDEEAKKAVASGVAVAKRPVLVSLQFGAPVAAHANAFLKSAPAMKSESLDTNALRITVLLPLRDSIFRGITPVVRWVTDDSLAVTVGDTTIGYQIPSQR